MDAQEKDMLFMVPDNERMTGDAALKRAENILRGWEAFDFEAHEKGQGIGQLLEKPFGESADCLSLIAMSEAVFARERGESTVWDKFSRHMAVCGACRDGFVEWEDAKVRVARGLEANATAAPSPKVWIDSPHELDLVQGVQVQPFVIVADADFEETLGEVDPAGIELSGFASAKAESVAKLDNPAQFGGAYALRIEFVFEWEIKAGDGLCDWALIHLPTKVSGSIVAKKLLHIRQMVPVAKVDLPGDIESAWPEGFWDMPHQPAWAALRLRLAQSVVGPLSLFRRPPMHGLPAVPHPAPASARKAEDD